ncbi:MAG: Flp pilus assembly protein CpaB [Bryobacteraceae bacterium]|nr:Flp pilus assembly protein CpaB [Bryobacteraceae bacterium]
MKRNLMPLLGVAFVAALVATGFFYGLLIPRLRGGGETVEARSAVVAKRSLNRGVQITAEDLERAAVEPANMPKEPVRSIEAALGLTLLEPTGPGQPLSVSMMTRRGETGGPAMAIPSGMRAVTIHPAASGGVVSMLAAGGRIDVQVLDRSTGTIKLRRMMENVEVLSVSANRADVTLLVKPEEADRLSLADAAMSIRIVLRNPFDNATGGPKVLESAALTGARAERPAQGDLVAVR